MSAWFFKIRKLFKSRLESVPKNSNCYPRDFSVQRAKAKAKAKIAKASANSKVLLNVLLYVSLKISYVNNHFIIHPTSSSFHAFIPPQFLFSKVPPYSSPWVDGTICSKNWINLNCEAVVIWRGVVLGTIPIRFLLRITTTSNKCEMLNNLNLKVGRIQWRVVNRCC